MFNVAVNAIHNTYTSVGYYKNIIDPFVSLNNDNNNNNSWKIQFESQNFGMTFTMFIMSVNIEENESYVWNFHNCITL